MDMVRCAKPSWLINLKKAFKKECTAMPSGKWIVLSIGKSGFGCQGKYGIGGRILVRPEKLGGLPQENVTAKLKAV